MPTLGISRSPFAAVPPFLSRAERYNRWPRRSGVSCPLPITPGGRSNMPRPLSYVFALLIFALLIGGPVGYAYYQQRQFRNFHEVKSGVLYRSGQLPLSGLK